MIEKTLEAILAELKTLNSKLAESSTAPQNVNSVDTAEPPKSRTTKKEEAASPPAPKITREDLGKAMVALAKVNMQAASDILKGFGCAKLAELKEEHYVAAYAAVEKAQAAAASTEAFA